MNIASVYNYDPFSLYLYRKGGSILKGQSGLQILIRNYAKVLAKLKQEGESTKLNPMQKAQISQYLASSKNSEKEVKEVIGRFSTGKATYSEALVIKDLVENDIIKFNNITKDELISALENYTQTASRATRIWDKAKHVIVSQPKWLKWTELIAGGVTLGRPLLTSSLKMAGSALGGLAGDVTKGVIEGVQGAVQNFNDARGNQNEDTQTSDTITVTPIYDKQTGRVLIGYRDIDHPNNPLIKPDIVQNNIENGTYKIVNPPGSN